MRLPPQGFAMPNPFAHPAPAYDYAAPVPEYAASAWARAGAPQRLAFAPDDDAALAALGDLAVSFEAAPADPRTIRVRIHPASQQPDSSSSSSDAGSSRESSPPPLQYPAPWDADPFLGAPDFAAPFAPDGSLRYDLAQLAPHMASISTHNSHHHHLSSQQTFALDVPLDFAALDAMGFGGYASNGEMQHHAMEMESHGGMHVGCGETRQRVRIALKSAPAPGGEGGEWEVSLC